MNKRILIIDDEDNIRQMCRLALETTGYEVGEAADGIEAMAILGGDPAWDVILLDQRLPVMEGTEVLRRISVLAPSARVVMMTAFASIELAVTAMKLGATDFLRKPMTPEIVRNSVSAALSKASRPYADVESSASHRDKARARSVTMNGFTILSETEITVESLQPTNERQFLVRNPKGKEQKVVVEISEEALNAAEQIVKGAAIEKEFWTSQAASFLSAFIWNDGNVPAGGKLVLRGVDRSELELLVKQKRSNE